MKIFEYTEDINVDTAHISDELSDILYFDIETTGLSAKRSDLYLIGCSYFSDSAFRTQLIFNDNGTSEPEMLSHFEQLLKNHKILVSYNGDTFDIPYLLKKMEQFDVDTALGDIQSVDIYRTTRKYKKLLRLDSAKQFDIEHLVDFQRNTFISGGDLISAYKHYLGSHDESLLDDMLTHNHDDIRGLISISEFVNIPHIPEEFQIEDISDTIDSITYNCSIPKLPCRITESLNGILVNANDTHMHIVVPKAQNVEMKYFFKDYKNYFTFRWNTWQYTSPWRHTSMIPTRKRRQRRTHSPPRPVASYPVHRDFVGRYSMIQILMETIFLQTALKCTKQASNPTPISLQS